jgi:hypothetical protein
MYSEWCVCVPPSGSQRGWTLNPLTGVWVCSICRNPSKATYLSLDNLPVID